MKTATWVVGGIPRATFEQRDGADLVFDRVTSSLGGYAETERAPRQDGQSTYYVSLGSQTVTLIGAMQIFGGNGLLAKAAFERMRSYLADAFAPNVKGTLVYETEGATLSIECHAAETPAFGDVVGVFCPVTITFAADAPRWRYAEERVVLGRVTKLYHEPWNAVASPLGLYEPAVTANNRGSAPVYPIVEVTGVGQTVTIRNITTGKHLTVESSLAAGETMVVDMYAGTVERRFVDGTTEDASHLISLDSELWTLEAGGNTLRVDIEDITAPPICVVRWSAETAGV